MRTRLPLSRNHQRGAILIMTAAFIVAAVALLALAVDTGRLYAAQQKLQSAANLAAIAAARQASGCRLDDGTEDIFDPDAGKTVAGQIVQNNYQDAQPAPMITAYERGNVATTNDPDAADNGLRRFSPGNGASTTKPDSVRLTLTDNNYAPLFALFRGEKNIPLHASAGAISRPEATIQIGTTLADANPDILGNLLGVNLAVADAGSLAQTNVTLAQLLDANAGVVTPEGVANITINDALNNVSDDLNGSASTIVGTLQQQLGDQPLSDILSVAGTVGSDASLSLGSIVNSAAQLVARDDENPVSLTLPSIDLPAGLGGVAASLRILEPAQSTIGPAGRSASGNYYTEVNSAQVALILNLNLDLLQTGLVHLPLVVNVADGSARLERIDCPSPTDQSYRVQIHGSTSTVTAGVGTIENGQFVPGEISVLANSITASNSDPDNLSRISPTDYDVSFDVSDLDDLPETRPPPDLETLSTAELTGLLSNIDLDIDIGGNLPLVGDLLDALGDLFGGGNTTLTSDILLAPVNALLNNLLAPALAPVLDPLLDALGISLSTADITLQDITQSQPTLFCTSDLDCGFDEQDAS